MKKLSMLAAGVAVLSMCACTEANEFTPSTNNSTKKITEIKVSANPSALGSRTVFHTGDDGYAYGVVTWEEGVDKIYFYKSAANPQCFTCGMHDKTDDDYDWNYFKADKDGLDVGSYYYVNNEPKGFENNYGSCFTFTIQNDLEQNGGSEDDVLKQFMKDYDLLMSSGPVLAKEEMEPIKMNHAFSLIAVKLQCTNSGKFEDNSQKPLFYGMNLSVKNSDDASCLYTKFSNGYSGELTFTSSATALQTNFKDEFQDLWKLGEKEGDELTFYFMLKTSSLVRKLEFTFKTQSPVGSGSTTTEKMVTLNLNNDFEFKPGNVYSFGFGVDYQPEGFSGHMSSSAGKYLYDDDWHSLDVDLIRLSSIPSGMSVESVITKK